MIKTLDNVKCKRGDVVFEIGVNIEGIYRPCRSIVHRCLTNPDRCWKACSECQKECDLLNSKGSLYQGILTVNRMSSF
jgi:hypothetical protein